MPKLDVWDLRLPRNSNVLRLSWQTQTVWTPRTWLWPSCFPFGAVGNLGKHRARVKYFWYVWIVFGVGVRAENAKAWDSLKDKLLLQNAADLDVLTARGVKARRRLLRSRNAWVKRLKWWWQFGHQVFRAGSSGRTQKFGCYMLLLLTQWRPCSFTFSILQLRMQQRQSCNCTLVLSSAARNSAEVTTRWRL